MRNLLSLERLKNIKIFLVIIGEEYNSTYFDEWQPIMVFLYLQVT